MTRHGVDLERDMGRMADSLDVDFVLGVDLPPSKVAIFLDNSPCASLYFSNRQLSLEKTLTEPGFHSAVEEISEQQQPDIPRCPQ